MSTIFSFLGLVARCASSPYFQSAYKDWDDMPGGEHVHKLTDSNLQSFVKKHSSVFIFFYKPGCPYCHAMRPDLAQAAAALKQKSDTAKIASLNVAAYDPVFKISGVPTMYFFRDGQFVGEYRRDRRAPAILNFILQETYATG